MVTQEPGRAVLLERAEELAAIDAVVADTVAGRGRFGAIEGQVDAVAADFEPSRCQSTTWLVQPRATGENRGRIGVSAAQSS